jgi:hypothetical protein
VNGLSAAKGPLSRGNCDKGLFIWFAGTGEGIPFGLVAANIMRSIVFVWVFAFADPYD